MLKRARLLARSNPDPQTCEDVSRKKGGEELRQFLLERFCLEGLSGCDVATLSNLITRAGGLGVADLALEPASASKNGHRHVKARAGNVFPEVDLTYVDCPVYLKREARRSIEKIPIHCPSKALENNITEDMVHRHPHKDFDKKVGGLENYRNHPVVLQAKADGLKAPVRPLALYWDGVVYTKNDSFFGFYVTDILTGQKFLSFLVRQRLN